MRTLYNNTMRCDVKRKTIKGAHNSCFVLVTRCNKPLFTFWQVTASRVCLHCGHSNNNHHRPLCIRVRPSNSFHSSLNCYFRSLFCEFNSCILLYVTINTLHITLHCDRQTILIITLLYNCRCTFLSPS